MPASLARVGQLDDVVDGAQLGVHRRVPAFGRADRPRAAGVVGRRRRRVVATLALGRADRVDRRQVDDVEAHRLDVVEPVDGVGQRAVARRRGERRAGEELVPRAEAGAHRVDLDVERLGQLGDGLAHAGAPEQRFEVEAASVSCLRLDVVEVGDVPVEVVWQVLGRQLARAGGRRRPRAAGAGARSAVGVVALGPGERSVDQPDADLQVDGDVDAGRQLELHAVAPRAEVVEPADHLVLPAAELVGHERRLEAVVAERRHRQLLPPAAAAAAVRAARRRRGRGRR